MSREWNGAGGRWKGARTARKTGEPQSHEENDARNWCYVSSAGRAGHESLLIPRGLHTILAEANGRG